MTGALSNCGFIQLNRRFHELSWSIDDGDENIHYSALHRGISWSNLLQEFRVIVLSEAGTGKTEEIRNVTQTLRNEGKEAFFLRLEHISAGFEDSFELGTYAEFTVWKASGKEGWVFLDSVDEARLKNSKDFELAIRKLGREFEPMLQITHIIITSRTPAWRRITDVDLCRSHIPYTQPITFIVESDDENQQIRNAKNKQEEVNNTSLKIVSMDDLNRNQVKTFAKARNISDVGQFLEEISKKDAWQLTKRPQDLEELIELWKQHNRIGSSLELIKNSIERRLTERDQDRAEARPMPNLLRIREGAQLVAAVTTLTKTSTISVPDGDHNAKGIPISEILPDWNVQEQAALLLRPIFTGGIYGTVRFYHRSISEYLTAEWLSLLLKRESSRRIIENLLFKEQYGLKVIIPTMRPVLLWLALLDSKILERLYTTAPEILFEVGDPSQLPINIRQETLHKVCDLIAAGMYNETNPIYTSIQKFANEDLTDVVKEEFAKNRNNEQVNRFLLRMVWAGNMKGALQEAKSFALNPSTPMHMRLAAFDAVKAAGTVKDIKEVQECFLNESDSFNRNWLASLLEGLDPSPENINWLLKCLPKADNDNLHNLSNLTNELVTFIQHVDIDSLPHIVFTLGKLLDTPPVISDYFSVSQRFVWTLKAATSAVIRLIEKRNPAALEENSIAILNKAATAYVSGEGHIHKLEETEACLLKELVPLWPEFNRAYFWFDVDKANKLHEKGSIEHYLQLPYLSPFWKFTNDDFDYLLSQIEESSSLSRQRIALSLACKIFDESGRVQENLDKLKKATSIKDELTARIENYLNPQEDKALKEEEAKWELKVTELEKEQSDWRKYLQENVNSIRNHSLQSARIFMLKTKP